MHNGGRIFALPFCARTDWAIALATRPDAAMQPQRCSSFTEHRTHRHGVALCGFLVLQRSEELAGALCLKVAGSIPDEVTEFFNRPNPSSRTMALGSTQPLTEMSSRNLPGGKGRPARKTGNFTPICESIV
jgi:hypothetical protein